MRDYFDITPPITAQLAVFPGDTPFKRTVHLDTGQGDGITLSSMTTTLHCGAHVDAPNHYSEAGQDIASRSLDFYLGPCQVIHCRPSVGLRLQIADLADAAITAPRVLLATGSFPDPNQWCDDFCGLEPALVDYLAEQGVRLIGIDTPSVDPANDTLLLSHARVSAHDMAILEGVVLTEVPAGHYELIALPLPIAGGDASPVRAILLPSQTR